MKKALFMALVAAFVLAFAGVAAAATPTVIDPVTGASMWTYQDLQDVTPKYEGGYAAFDNSGETTYAVNPHGGYDTTTNKCKVCHAVHRAEGAYYLLRADSQDDACDYCHIGGSAHSTLIVYDLNSGGKYTANGHTIGAQAWIPDSTVDQWTEEVTLSTTDANGNPLSETIHVRAYDTSKNAMYRFARHHGHGAAGTGRSGYSKIGPLALRCMNCHQPHNAINQTWRPADFNGANEFLDADTAATRSGYKLLKMFPSGSTTGTVNTYGYYDASQAIAVPETTLTAGFNYSQHNSAESTYYLRSAGNASGLTTMTVTQPVWIAQHIGAHTGHEHGPDRDGQTVNNMALSVWCADCHNLNIGGWETLSNVELGFKAHTERTHPAPYSGAYNGPGQCYSCHRNDLSPKPAAPAYATGFRTGCEQCHYGTASYYSEAANDDASHDFPHSGQENSIKMLGAYSFDPASPTGASVPTTITTANLDAVCIRCHGGIGVNH